MLTLLSPIPTRPSEHDWSLRRKWRGSSRARFSPDWKVMPWETADAWWMKRRTAERQPFSPDNHPSKGAETCFLVSLPPSLSFFISSLRRATTTRGISLETSIKSTAAQSWRRAEFIPLGPLLLPFSKILVPQHDITHQWWNSEPQNPVNVLCTVSSTVQGCFYVRWDVSALTA